MTQPPNQLQFRTDVETDMELLKVPAPGGELVVAMIRQMNTMLVVPMDYGRICKWIGDLTGFRDSMSSSGRLATAQSPLITGSNGRRP